MTSNSSPLSWEEEDLDNPTGSTAWVLNISINQLILISSSDQRMERVPPVVSSGVDGIGRTLGWRHIYS